MWKILQLKRVFDPNIDSKSVAEFFRQIAFFFFDKLAEEFPRDLATVLERCHSGSYVAYNTIQYNNDLLPRRVSRVHWQLEK